MAVAADGPNSSSSSTQQRRGSGGGQLRASEPLIIRLMNQCLGGCALTYASARGVHAHKVKRKSHHPHTAEATTTDYSQQQQQTGPTSVAAVRCSGGGQLRASEPPIVRLITPCLGGCVLFTSVTCAVFEGCLVSGVLCVVCLLFIVMIRTYIVIMYVLLRGFFATARKHVRHEKLSQNIKRNRIFARNRYTVTVNGIPVSPSWFYCSRNS